MHFLGGGVLGEGVWWYVCLLVSLLKKNLVVKIVSIVNIVTMLNDVKMSKF